MFVWSRSKISAFVRSEPGARAAPSLLRMRRFAVFFFLNRFLLRWIYFVAVGKHPSIGAFAPPTDVECGSRLFTRFVKQNKQNIVCKLFRAFISPTFETLSSLLLASLCEHVAVNALPHQPLLPAQTQHVPQHSAFSRRTYLEPRGLVLPLWFRFLSKNTSSSSSSSTASGSKPQEIKGPRPLDALILLSLGRCARAPEPGN